MAASRSSSDLVIRRKMRKGTHSCFECRRRKIRCIFPPDNPSVCTECFARGSRCIDQEHASPESIVDHRKNLRERVSRLEALVDQLLEDKTERGAAETLSALKESPIPMPPTPLSGDAAAATAAEVGAGNEQVPILSMFDNDVLSRAESPTSEHHSTDSQPHGHHFSSGTTANGTTIDFHCAGGLNQNYFTSATAIEKHIRVRRAIQAALPPLPRILEIFKTNGAWWLTFRAKCPGTTSMRFRDLVEFTRHAYTNGSPQQLGILALAVGVSIDGDDIDTYLSLVDRWILSDDEYASTLEGMECLILQAKCYADIGQPRKAWIIYRRGLMFAQLLGLHRNHSLSVERDNIWWVLYAADRFMSLLLGLPYGIPDSHCDLEIKGPMADHSRSHLVFLLNISIIAGKVIDRCQGNSATCLSTALDLDTQLDEIAAKVPNGWWDINPLVADMHREQSAAELRERVINQIAFHQVRVYLHLPFMLKSASNPRFEYSRTTCLNSSREMLRLYQFLRAGNGEPLYECKAVDFVGFTAAILVLLGLLGYGRMNPIHDPKQEESDWRMIEVCMDIFQRASSEKGGKVAAQSYKVLEQLSQVRHMENSAGNEEYSTKIAIPYFGTISIRRGQKFNSQSTKSATLSPNSSRTPAASTVSSNSPRPSGNLFGPGTNINHFPTPPLSTHSRSTPTGTATSSPQQPLAADPFIAYDGFYMPQGFDTSNQQVTGEDGLMNFTNPTQWGIGMPMGLGAGQMDIDQDWTMFLSDQNVGAGNQGFAAGAHQDQGYHHQSQMSGPGFFALG